MSVRLRGILALGAPFILGGCHMALLDPQGSIGEYEKNLIVISTILMLLVVVPVIIMACVFAYRYRAGNTQATYKPEWDFSHKIELTVWTIPCLIVLVLSILCWKSTHDLDPANPLKSGVKPIEIDVVAMDWKWLFIYPEQHIAAVNQVAFPVDMPVKFVLTSDSVMNSFFIPRLGSMLVFMPGMKANLYLIANHPGTYDGLSGQFSGDGFSGMTFKALAVSNGEFNQWVAKVRQASEPLTANSYDALNKPSEDVPVRYYSTIDPALFDAIIDKYMGEVTDQGNGPKAGSPSPMKMDMDMDKGEMK